LTKKKQRRAKTSTVEIEIKCVGKNLSSCRDPGIRQGAFFLPENLSLNLIFLSASCDDSAAFVFLLYLLWRLRRLRAPFAAASPP
jgi:hypothetical protein